MGCDIHVYTEYRRGYDWYNCDMFMINSDKYAEDFLIDGKYIMKPIYDGRSYTLFGLLAGVRDNDVDSIDSPRGLPESATDFVKSQYEIYKSDWHSASYLSAEEIFKRYYDEKHFTKDFDNMCALRPLIFSIEQRMADVFPDVSYSFGAERDEKIKQHAKDFRIVFWFDS